MAPFVDKVESQKKKCGAQPQEFFLVPSNRDLGDTTIKYSRFTLGAMQHRDYSAAEVNVLQGCIGFVRTMEASTLRIVLVLQLVRVASTLSQIIIK